MLRMSYDVFVRSFGQETLALQNRLEDTTYPEHNV